MEVELNWKDKDISVDRISLPFQTVEKLTEKRILKQKRLDKWAEGIDWPEDYPKDWRNRLIWGDNKYIMSSLLRKGFGGEIDLIYIDPPFATGADFSMPIEVGDIETTKEPSVIEKTAYQDTWGKGLSSYLQMMYERLVLMKELLSRKGAIYVHQGYYAGHYVKILLDNIFGRENFRNEIIPKRVKKSIRERERVKSLSYAHDVIFFYAKSDEHTIKPPTVEVDREPRWHAFDAPGIREGMDYELFGHTPPSGRHWMYEKEKAEKMIEEGTLRPSPSTGKPQYLIPGSKEDVRDTLWTDFSAYSFKTDFETEKSEELLEQIIEASSEKGDIIADFFCGSGTTGIVAEKLGRRWIMSDLSKFAINTTRKRLLDLHNYSKDYDKPCRPFMIQNLGSYQKHKFIENEHPPVKEYRKFILNLYEAESVEGYSFVHGKRGNSFVHIGGVDSIVTANEVEDAVQECVNALGGSTLDILGWDFELGLDKTVEDIEEMYGIEINLKQIPREAAELKKVSDPDEIKFFDLNYVETEHEISGKEIKVKIKDFVLANPEYIDEEVSEKVEDSTDWIDYWSVDFDYQGNVFHNMWQSFRTKNDRELSTVAKHRYDEGGVKNIFVKVIDIFGNDTNSVFEVEI